MTSMKIIFPANNLATTMGATDLAAEIVASQPRISIPVEEEVEYEFDQQKFKDYLSSSSGSTSPLKSKKLSSRRKVRWYEEVQNANEDLTPIDAKVALGEVPPTSNQVKAVLANSSAAEGVVTLSKRARQRRHQRLARQFAKAMESTDGIRYNADLKNRRGKQPQQPMNASSSKPPTNEWIRVKQNRSTLEERIRKRRALLAQARAQVQEARKRLQKEVAKKSPLIRQVWRPKSKAVIQAKEKSLQPSAQVIPVATPGDPAESSRREKSVLERLGLLPDEGCKAPVQERLGPIKKPRTTQHAESRRHPQHDKKIMAARRTNLRIEVQEPAENSRPQRHVSRRVTLENPKKAVRPQKETLSSDNDDVIPEKSCQHTIGYSDLQADELYYRVGGTSKTRKMSPRELETQCPCSKLIQAVLYECNCIKTVPERISVFERLSTKTPKPRRRRFRQRKTVVEDREFPRVTTNMTSKGTSTRNNPESIPEASRRITRLQSGPIVRGTYGRIRTRLPSEDEESDACSAVASDNTVSSEGQPRESLMITTEQVAKMLEEAMAKQQESFKEHPSRECPLRPGLEVNETCPSNAKASHLYLIHADT
ncbi:uncharacterized protein A4U43_C04F28830 [Asparagus officinalis]|uniref:Uncharacterized protein n=1 Tax=Asparagus officinalis TaxID=4686 RepID=A0A5P1F9N6_ASPOF|nr:uncharacterized protein A4U43_C04F28830 [Asparagus officinalis]